MSHHIFISYSRSDNEVMQRIRADLEAVGLIVWTDKGIPPGAPSWKIEIEDAIREADCIVVLFSPEAAQSRWVRAELDFADAQKKPFFPILVSGDASNAVPFGFTTYQWIDIRDPDTYRERIPGLIEAIREQIAHGSTPVDAAPPRQVVPPSVEPKLRRLNPVVVLVPLLVVLIGAAALFARSQSGDAQVTPTSGISESIPTQVEISPEITSETLEGWRVVTVENVSIAVPPDWNRLSNNLFRAMMSTIVDALQVPLPQQSTVDYLNEHMLFYVGNWLDFEGAVILVEDTSLLFTDPDLIRDRLQTVYSSESAIQVQSLQVQEFPAGQAYLIKWTFDPNGNEVNSLHGYLIIRGPKWYSIIFAFPSPSDEKYAAAQPVIDQMMQSLRISDEATEEAP